MLLPAILLLFVLLCSTVLLPQYVYTIDENEKLAYEGVWFPQYRSRATNNKQYTCHILYERVYYEDKPKLIFHSYYTFKGIPQTESYDQSYSPGVKRGITVDDEGTLEGYGPYKIYNYILKLTSEFRVRYLCTDYRHARKNVTMVYIETRSMTPKLQTIKEAVNVLRENRLYVKLDRIVQRGCKRPLGPDGYESLDKEQRSISTKPNKP